MEYYALVESHRPRAIRRIRPPSAVPRIVCYYYGIGQYMMGIVKMEMRPCNEASWGLLACSGASWRCAPVMKLLGDACRRRASWRCAPVVKLPVGVTRSISREFQHTKDYLSTVFMIKVEEEGKRGSGVISIKYNLVGKEPKATSQNFFSYYDEIIRKFLYMLI
jgi:hypothetical protein